MIKELESAKISAESQEISDDKVDLKSFDQSSKMQTLT